MTDTSVAAHDPAGAQLPKPLSRRLIDENGDVARDPNRSDVESRVRDGKWFWLDLPGIGDEEETLLRDVFGLHPLTVDDAKQFGERAKFEDHDGYALLVLFGSGAKSADSSNLVNGSDAAGGTTVTMTPIDVADLSAVSEVHCIVAAKYLITIHRGDCPALHGFLDRAENHPPPQHEPARLLYRLADALADSFFPVLAELDDRIDALQAQIMVKPTNDQLSELLKYRGSLVGMRRVVAPQRDVFASLASGVTDLPGFDDDDLRYLRDVYDHLIRLSDLIDGYRDLLSGTTDAYLSVVSNQLNVVMKQLSVIATVFLPLSFLTGFFGQNFSWLVNNLGGPGTFILLGLGSEVVAVVLLMVLFRKRGWLGN